MTSFVDEPAHLVQLRDSIRRFVEREMPRDAVRRWDRERMFPREVFHRLAATGVCGLTVAEEYGGAGRDIVAAVTVIDELARRGTALVDHRSEEHTSELQSHHDLVCRLLLEKKKKNNKKKSNHTRIVTSAVKI